MSENPFRVTRGERDGSTVVGVEGEVDASTAPTLEAEVALALAEAPGALDLVIDLSEVGFMDSSGLRVLISALNAVREREGTLTLHEPSEVVAQLLEVTQLAGRLTITRD